MDKYYKILGIPTTATLDEIKAQYRQLRLKYHPDRFHERAQKTLAEEKLKAISEAYYALADVAKWHRVEITTMRADAPLPVLSTDVLDFGQMSPRQTSSLRFQVHNTGGKVNNFSLVYSELDGWFTVDVDRPDRDRFDFPVDIIVTADTSSLVAGQTYTAWLAAEMDEVVARLALSVAVAAPHRVIRSAAMAFAGLLVILMIGVGLRAWAVSSSLFGGPEKPLVTKVVVSAAGAGQAGVEPNLLAFTILEEHGPTLYVAQPDGSKQQSLGLLGKGPVWSPMENRLAYLARVHDVWQIHVTQGGGAHSRQLSYGMEQKLRPSWADDGKTLAFLADHGTHRQLHVIDVETQESQPVTDASRDNVYGSSWFKNAQSLLIDMERNGVRRIFLARLGDGVVEPLPGAVGRAPDWSSQQALIVAASDSGLLTYDEAGQGVEQLTNTPAVAPSWSADGQHIAYLTAQDLTPTTQSGRQYDLWVMDADGQNQRQITQGDCLEYAWSPNDDRLVYVTGTLNAAAPTLYLWIVELGMEPRVIAEINDAAISWAAPNTPAK